MEYDFGEILTRWTIRVAVAFYLVRVAADVAGRDTAGNERIARLSWTVALAFYLVHVVCAFHFYHDWSHTAAYIHTAKATAKVVSIDWGGGLYVNYTFTLIWIADVIVWWHSAHARVRVSRRLFWATHILFAFMMLNATVVFGPAFWKWVAMGVTLALIGILTTNSLRKSK